jgi:hypothetical protein
MHNRKSDNKTLDAVGRKLVGRSALPLDEVEKIVSNPRLFALVSKRIEANVKVPANRVSAPFFRRNAIAFAGLAVILVAAFAAASLLRPDSPVLTTKEGQVPEAFPEVARPVIPPQGIVEKLSTGRATKRDFRVERTVEIRSAERFTRPLINAEPEAEFYPVAYTGDPDETSDGGRIIRVDLKRSSLFALGINLPLENDDATVKADLFIGSDGVTRAIRVVR